MGLGKARRVFLVAFLFLASVATLTRGYRDRPRHGDNGDDEIRLSDMKERLEILTNEVIELKKNCKSCQMSFKANTTTDDKKGTKTDGPTGSAKLLFVKRDFIDDGDVQFTVRYKTPSIYDRPTVYWLDGEYKTLKETLSNHILRLPRGVYQTTVTTKAQNDSRSIVNFQVGIGKTWLNVLLRNNIADGNALDDAIEMPIFEVFPKGDVVYEPGHNITMKIIHPAEGERYPGSSSELFGAQTILMQPGDTKLSFNYGGGGSVEDFFQIKGEEKKFLDRVEIEVELNTKKYTYSGIMSLYAGVNKNTGVVKRIEERVMIVLRPSTQTDPFPDNGIYTPDQHMHNSKPQENGDVLKFCVYGQECIVYCQVYGNRITNLTMLKTTANGVTTSEKRFQVYDGSTSFHKGGMVNVTSTHNPNEFNLADPPVTYSCVASNAFGRSKTFNTVVEFGREVKLLRNESSVHYFQNDTALVVCTAQGVPTPNVTIMCDGFPQDNLQVFVVRDDAIRVQATCHDITRYGWITCTTESDFGSDYYSFDDAETGNVAMSFQ